MKTYRISLFIVAGLLALTLIKSIVLPSWFYLITRCLLLVVGLYSIVFYRRWPMMTLFLLVFAAVIYNPFFPIEFAQPAGRIITLATAAGFIRLGLSLSNRSQKSV